MKLLSVILFISFINVSEVVTYKTKPKEQTSTDTETIIRKIAHSLKLTLKIFSES